MDSRCKHDVYNEPIFLACFLDDGVFVAYHCILVDVAYYLAVHDESRRFEVHFKLEGAEAWWLALPQRHITLALYPAKFRLYRWTFIGFLGASIGSHEFVMQELSRLIQ